MLDYDGIVLGLSPYSSRTTFPNLYSYESQTQLLIINYGHSLIAACSE